jgi:hypothetical protein
MLHRKIPPPVLSVELERAALRAVRATYADINGSLFDWQLEYPLFELTDKKSVLGRWLGGARVLELSRSLLIERGWAVLIEVLKHEMAHQYVDEILGRPDESGHGPEFRRVCEERGIDARAAGYPESKAGASGPTHVLDRIAKLLALAESPNEHEAQAAMSAAQRLMLKHNIESVLGGRESAYTIRHLGAPSGRVPESQRMLAGILTSFFFVKGIWIPVWRPLEGKRGSVLEVCGTLENLELAEYVHAFLNHTAERLWLEYKKQRSSAGRRENFIAGVMSGFRDRLERERKKSEQEGLVWVGDGELEHFLRRRHPQIRWTRRGGGRATEAYKRGREAGQSIVLHRGIRSGPSGAGPKLLT